MEEIENGSFHQWLTKNKFLEQKNSIENSGKYLALSYYSIIFVPVDQDENIQFLEEVNGTKTFPVFTDRPNSNKFEKFKFYTEYTLGELCSDIQQNYQNSGYMQLIKINPQTVEKNKINPCEEIIFCPMIDSKTNQLTITSLDKTLPLMALDQSKIKKMGFEAVYGFFRDGELSNKPELRTQSIFEMIDFLNFVLKRTPLKFGSSSIFCLFLDFENPIEENQFIQDYKLLDTYSNVLYVNSNLDLINSYRQKISYEGDQMETILLPIINWQQNNNLVRQELI